MKIASLESHALADGLTEVEIAHLGDLFIEERFNAGDSLFVEGQPSRGLVFVARGRMRVVMRGHEAREHTLFELVGPTVIGEMEIVSGHPSMASVIAETDLVAHTLSHAAFAALIDCGDIVGGKILRNIARVMARRVEQTNARLLSLLDPGQTHALESLKKHLITEWKS